MAANTLRKYKQGRLSGNTMSKIILNDAKRIELYKRSKQLEIRFTNREYDKVVTQLGQLQMERMNIMKQVTQKFQKKLLPYAWFNFDTENRSIYMIFKGFV